LRFLLHLSLTLPTHISFVLLLFCSSCNSCQGTAQTPNRFLCLRCKVTRSFHVLVYSLTESGKGKHEKERFFVFLLQNPMFLVVLFVLACSGCTGTSASGFRLQGLELKTWREVKRERSMHAVEQQDPQR